MAHRDRDRTSRHRDSSRDRPRSRWGGEREQRERDRYQHNSSSRGHRYDEDRYNKRHAREDNAPRTPQGSRASPPPSTPETTSNAPRDDEEDTVEAAIRIRLLNAGLTEPHASGYLNDDAVLIVNDLLFNFVNVQAQADHYRAENLILRKKLNAVSGKRTAPPNSDDDRPTKRHEAAIEPERRIEGTTAWGDSPMPVTKPMFSTTKAPPADVVMKPAAPEDKTCIKNIPVPGPIRTPESRTMDPAEDHPLPMRLRYNEDDEPEESDDETTDEEDGLGRKRSMTEVAAIRHRNQKRQDRRHRLEMERNLAIHSYSGRVPDVWGVVKAEDGSFERDNSFRGMLPITMYYSKARNTVFTRRTGLDAEYHERVRGTPFLHHSHPIYRRVPRGMPRSPMEVDYLQEIVRDAKIPNWARIEAHTLITEFRVIAEGTHEGHRDRAMSHIVSLPCEKADIDAPDHLWKRIVIHVGGRPSNPLRKPGMAMIPTDSIMNIDMLAAYTLMHSRPGTLSPTCGAIMNRLGMVDRRSIFGVALSRVLSPLDKAARPSYREIIDKYNDSHPDCEFKPQTGPMYTFNRCTITAVQSNNIGEDDIANRFSGSYLDEDLLADVDDERLSRLATFGEPPAISGWDGWWEPSTMERTKLKLLIDFEERQKNPIFSLEAQGWCPIGRDAIDTYLDHRPREVIDARIAHRQSTSLVTSSITAANVAPQNEPHATLGDANVPPVRDMDAAMEDAQEDHTDGATEPTNMQVDDQPEAPPPTNEDTTPADA
ncbi:hypothetical protein CPC08DRAFT_769779 [Agrocybe pediades]|nr:hypothetical protein CPC08DRAFT_769779 [Agrocybe pediades]